MIHINHLTFGYGSNPLFSRLNLSIGAGYIYGLFGKNGVGKTTLLKLISGLRFAQSGECRVLDNRSADRPYPLLKELFFLPEEFFLTAITARQYEKRYAVFYPRFDSERFYGWLEEFDLDLSKKVNAYSFGQKKKFILAFGLATNCKLMLLDEPTNGLDIPSKRQFRKILASAVADDRLFVISTHQARDLENIIDAVIILDNGEIVFNQPLTACSSRLGVHFQHASPEPDKTLYAEKVPGGYSVVIENPTGQETVLDLEILFNTVISDPGRIAALFAKEASDD